MVRDPKLGYHWLWIYPLFFLSLIVSALAFPFIKFIDFYQEYQHRRHMQRIYKKIQILKIYLFWQVQKSS
jgi:hypothetical protein